MSPSRHGNLVCTLTLVGAAEDVGVQGHAVIPFHRTVSGNKVNRSDNGRTSLARIVVLVPEKTLAGQDTAVLGHALGGLLVLCTSLCRLVRSLQCSRLEIPEPLVGLVLGRDRVRHQLIEGNLVNRLAMVLEVGGLGAHVAIEAHRVEALLGLHGGVLLDELGAEVAAARDNDANVLALDLAHRVIAVLERFRLLHLVVVVSLTVISSNQTTVISIF